MKTLTEGFDFNEHIDTDETNSTFAKTLSNDVLVLRCLNITLDIVTTYVKQHFYVTGNINVLPVNENDMLVSVLYSPKNSVTLPTLWLFLYNDTSSNQIGIFVQNFKPFEHNNDTDMMTLAYELAFKLQQVKKVYIVPMHHISTYVLNAFCWRNDDVKTIKRFVMEKEDIDKLPSISVTKKTNIRLDGICFRDEETIDYFIDYLFKDATPDMLKISLSKCVLSTEPSYGLLNNGRNPGNTARYIRKSIGRYQKKTSKKIQEAFNFNELDNLGETNLCDKLSICKHIREENQITNHHRFKHISNILNILIKSYGLRESDFEIFWEDIVTDAELIAKRRTVGTNYLFDYSMNLPDISLHELLILNWGSIKGGHLYYAVNIPDNLRDYINNVIMEYCIELQSPYTNEIITNKQKRIILTTPDNNIIIVASTELLYIIITNTTAIQQSQHIIDGSTTSLFNN